MLPLTNLENRGNTCWAAATVQALRALKSFVRGSGTNTVFGKAIVGGVLSDSLVPHVFRWTRACLKNNEGKGHRPADPAEFLVELFDRDDVKSKCFESKRVRRFECQTCRHVRTVESEEKMLIVNVLMDGPNPVQRAVDQEFGYVEQQRPKRLPSVPTVPSLPKRRRLPVGSMAIYKRGFAGPNGYAEDETKEVQTQQLPDDEVWWRCDDGSVVEVSLGNNTPYVLFYEERDTAVKKHESSLRAKEASSQQKNGYQVMELDCDEGKCLGTKQPHTVYVETYEVGSVLAVHVACPRMMNVQHLERTLLTKSEAGGEGMKAYDLRSFIDRVGDCHYVAYVRKK